MSAGPAGLTVLAALLAATAVLLPGAPAALTRSRLRQRGTGAPRHGAGHAGLGRPPAGRPGGRGHRTAGEAVGPGGAAPAEGEARDRAGPLRPGAALLAAAGTVALVPGPAGVALGALVGVGALQALRGLEDPREARRRERVVADLPVAAELLAAAVRSGSTVEAAAVAVADGLGGPLGEELRRVVGLVRLGADPAHAWASFAAAPAPAAAGVTAAMTSTGRGSGSPRDEAAVAFARAVARALGSGAPLAPALERVAREQRARARARAEEAARRVGVLAVGPLTLCFLPAFVLVGVVPVVVGVLGEVLGATA
ncbi:type II secretion system F family protein [Vallicoccus soli]|uniref:type II secretion system F family protein n=1 Tax=Vallicoccus soli TaxID=2339232 RepID=UPI001403364C|nr:type II secretion system F family protein [Vallicoccus soli]